MRQILFLLLLALPLHAHTHELVIKLVLPSPIGEYTTPATLNLSLDTSRKVEVSFFTTNSPFVSNSGISKVGIMDSPGAAFAVWIELNEEGKKQFEESFNRWLDEGIGFRSIGLFNGSSLAWTLEMGNANLMGHRLIIVSRSVQDVREIYRRLTTPTQPELK